MSWVELLLLVGQRLRGDGVLLSVGLLLRGYSFFSPVLGSRGGGGASAVVSCQMELLVPVAGVIVAASA